MMLVIVTAALTVACILLEGLVLSVLWKWFMVPAFGLPSLSVPYAIGLALIVGLLTAKVRKSEDVPDWTEFLAAGISGPLVSLGIGWLVKLAV